MDDFSPEFNEKIRKAYAQGHDPEDIISHLESTKNPEGLKWANQMRELQYSSDVVPMFGPSSSGAPAFRDTTSPLLDTYSRNAELVKEKTKDMTLEDQAILGAKVVGGLYAGKKAIDIGSRMLSNLTPQGRLETEKAKVDLELAKESSRNYAMQTQTAADKLTLEKQLAANSQPSSLEELKAKALINAEQRAQELHDFKMEQLKQKVIKGETQVDKIAVSASPMQAPEILNSTGLTGLTELEKEKGVSFPDQSKDELKTVLKGVNNTAINSGMQPPYPDLLTQPVPPATTSQDILATKAGINPSTSIPESQVLEATHANALNNSEKVTEIKDAIRPTLKTGSGMPAVQGTAPPGTVLRREFASAANIPSTYAFVPGGQLMDVVRNSTGQDAFTNSLLKFGGYPQTLDEAHTLSRSINESQSRLPRDVAKDLNIGLGEPTPSITQKIGKNKAIKLAGATGALILMTDLANARTPQEKREAMRNIGDAILPPSLTSTEAGAPTLPANAYSESRKLGSPFYKMFKEGILR